MSSRIPLGATCLEDNCRFCVWAPLAEQVQVHIVSPGNRLVPMERDEGGYHRATVGQVGPGALYFYTLDGSRDRPDPASRFQPQGVHGPSQVVDPRFPWNDHHWFGLPLREYLFYELHVGTYTDPGTFEAIIPRLGYLKELGVTALELMPVAQFPGSRNWGYDGTYPFAVQDSYGGPQGLRTLVDACHQSGLAVVLDVVYNHLGPEGNYLREYGPYFTDRYHTPWGEAVNFDGPHSDHVRRFFLENARYWVTECHIDALRVDAVHAILDFSAKPFLEDLVDTVHEQGLRLNRRIHVIPESALNDARLIRSRALGGLGMDAQWSDDFHHTLHTLLTGEQDGYYQDFGSFHHLEKCFQEGFVYSGQYSAYRQRRHGNSSRDIPGERFVVFSQNHDQVGNRMGGERLNQLVSFEKVKLAAGTVLLSPFLPLLFMGEEYGDPAPFPYFISHSDPDLVQAVRSGRKEEFSRFQWEGEPPDPQDPATFQSARLSPELTEEGRHQALWRLYRTLIALRREVAALARPGKAHMRVLSMDAKRLLRVERWSTEDRAVVLFHFGDRREELELRLPSGTWSVRLDSAETRWHGPGNRNPDELISTGRVRLSLQPHSFIVLTREEVL